MQVDALRRVSLTALVTLAFGCGGNVVVDGASSQGTGGTTGATGTHGTASIGVGPGAGPVGVGVGPGAGPVGVGVGGASGVGGFSASGGASTNVDAASSSMASAASSSSSSGAGGAPTDALWDILGLPDAMGTIFDRPVMTTDADGNTYFADSYAGGPAHFSAPLSCAAVRNLFVAKISPAGAVLWSRCVPLVPVGDNHLNHNLFATGIAVSPGGGLALLGSFSGSVDFGAGPLQTGSDVNVETFLAAFDPSSGAVAWSRQLDAYGENSVDSATSWSLTADVAGNLYIGGTAFESFDFGNGAALDLPPDQNALFVAKLDPTGAGIWATKLAHIVTSWAYPSTLVASSDGARCAIAAPFQGTADFGASPMNTTMAPLIAELDTGTGAIEWATLSTAHDNEIGLVAAFDGQGALLVGIPGTGKITKFDTTGAPTWTATLSPAGAGLVALGALAADANGDILFAAEGTASQVSINGAVVPCPHPPMGRCLLVGGLDAGGASTSVATFKSPSINPVAVAFGAGEHLVAGTFDGWIDFGSGPTPQPPSSGIFLAALP